MTTTTLTTALTTANTRPQRGLPHDRAEQVLYEHFIKVLCTVAQRDAQVLQDIERFGRSLRFEQGHLYFTLRDLFAFVAARCANDPGALRIDYLSFRRLIYSQPTNALLRQRGCMVELAQPHAEHARRVYRSVPHRGAE